MDAQEKLRLLKPLLEDAPRALFALGDEVGVIYQDEASEELDAHCDQCRDNLAPFRVRGSVGLPSYLTVLVGPTNFARLRDGWRASSGLDLTGAVLYFEGP